MDHRLLHYPIQSQIASSSVVRHWPQPDAIMDPTPYNQPSGSGEDDLTQSAIRNSERLIMSCADGSDGYPSQVEFNRKMESYIGRKKRSERTVVNNAELAYIHRLLSDPAVMRAETDASHRNWVKKTFTLRPCGAAGSIVCHRDKGQTIPQPIASKEHMYFILKQAHASEGHGGRDKTAKAVKKTHSFIRKGLICLFLEVCPTCRARNDAVKKDKPINALPGSSNSFGDGPPPLMWGLPQSELSRSSKLSSQGFMLGHDLGANPVLAVTRRQPTLTESGRMAAHPNNTHVRNNTYPQVDAGHDIHLAGPETTQYPLELSPPTIFNQFNASAFRSPQGSRPPAQFTGPFISVNSEINQLNHSNIHRHNNETHQQQLRPQRQHQQRSGHRQSGIDEPSQLFGDPNFPDRQRDEYSTRQQQVKLASRQHFELHPSRQFDSHRPPEFDARPQQFEGHPQQQFELHQHNVFSRGEFLQQPSYQNSHESRTDAILGSSNLYDPANAGYVYNRIESEDASPADDGLLHVPADRQHERMSSNNSTNEQFRALALRSSSVGPQTSGSHVPYSSLQVYQPSPSGSNSELFLAPSGIVYEDMEFLGPPAEVFEYQSSSAPSTAVSFWTRPDELPHSAMAGDPYTVGLGSFTDNQSAKGPQSPQRMSANLQSSEQERGTLQKPILSFSQHRSGSAPPLALVHPESLKVSMRLSASLGPDGGFPETMPRSAPAEMSNPMEKSLEEFLARIPRSGSISEKMLQELLGNVEALRNN